MYFSELVYNIIKIPIQEFYEFFVKRHPANGELRRERLLGSTNCLFFYIDGGMLPAVDSRFIGGKKTSSFLAADQCVDANLSL